MYVVPFDRLRLCDRCRGVAILRFCGMTQGLVAMQVSEGYVCGALRQVAAL
jgi:hypothetical protein